MVQWTISSDKRPASLASLEEGQAFLGSLWLPRKAKPAWARGRGYKTKGPEKNPQPLRRATHEKPMSPTCHNARVPRHSGFYLGTAAHHDRAFTVRSHGGD